MPKQIRRATRSQKKILQAFKPELQVIGWDTESAVNTQRLNVTRQPLAMTNDEGKLMQVSIPMANGLPNLILDIQWNELGEAEQIDVCAGDSFLASLGTPSSMDAPTGIRAVAVIYNGDTIEGGGDAVGSVRWLDGETKLAIDAGMCDMTQIPAVAGEGQYVFANPRQS